MIFQIVAGKILKSNNINCDNIEIKDGKTFSWGGRYSHDYSTRDTLFTELGVFETYKPIIKNSSNNNGILFLANIHPSLQLDVLRQMESNITMVVSDTMNLWLDMDLNGVKEVISKSNIFLLNDEEALQLTGQSDMEKAGYDILDEGPETVIIKLGGKGSLLFSKDEYFHVPCVPNIDVFDPTGAGDSFAGGLIGYISQHGFSDKKEALIYASAIASYTVSDFGINKLLNLNLDTIKSRVDLIKNIMKNQTKE